MECKITFKDITLKDKQIFETYLSQDQYQISDINFGNLYLWHKARKISYAILSDCLIIQTTYENKNPFYFFPIGKGDKLGAIKSLFTYAQTRGEVLEFHSLELENLDFLKAHFQLESFLNRDRSDYVYNISELINLSGRKYHKKKNHLNKFLQTYPHFSYEEITAQNANELNQTYQQWFEATPDPSDGLKNEFIGIQNALNHWNELDFIGGIVRIDGKIIAFSFGEVINEKMVVIHIEKADSSIHGAYQIINQQLLKNSFSKYEYANREEDLGIEGLRKAKMSYNPAFLVDKYEAKVLSINS